MTTPTDRIEELEAEVDRLRGMCEVAASVVENQENQLAAEAEMNRVLRTTIGVCYPTLPSYMGQSETEKYPCPRRLADKVLSLPATHAQRVAEARGECIETLKLIADRMPGCPCQDTPNLAKDALSELARVEGEK